MPVCVTCVPSPSQVLTWDRSSPQEFFLQREPPMLQPLVLPPGLSVRQALERVLRLPAVASKRYLTNKVRVAHLAFCAVPVSQPGPPPHWGFLGSGNEGVGERGVLSGLLSLSPPSVCSACGQGIAGPHSRPP